MPKNPTRKGFFFFLVEGWQPLPHCQDQLCRRKVRRGGWDTLPSGTMLFPHGQEQPCPALPSPRNIKESIKEVPFYASWLAVSCPRPSYTGSGQAQKAWGGAAFYIFPFFFKKQM